jgi:hypothetical protein
LTFEQDQETSVFEVLNKVDELNKMHITQEIISPGHWSRQREQYEYDVVILFLTNELIRSNSFKKEYTFLKDKGKPMLFVLINNIEINDLIDINGFKVIRFVEPINSDENKEALKHLQIFLFSVLTIKNIYFNEKIDDYSSRLQLVSNKKTFNDMANDCEIKLNDEIFLLSDDYTIKIVNYNNDKVLGKITLEDCEDLFCWIDHLKMVFKIQNRQNRGELYDINGQFVRKVKINSNVRFINRYSSVAYSKKNNETYFVNDEMDGNANSENGNSTIYTYDKKMKLKKYTTRIKANIIKIFEQYIYSIHHNSSDEIFIYNLSFNLVASIRKSMHIDRVFTDLKLSPFILMDRKIFDTKTFSFIGFVETQTSLITVFNDKMIFKDREGNYLIYKINLKTAQNNLIDSKYVCKINPLKPHLYQNPYLLPCGNSACLDCFYKHFNIYLNKFKCNFESCQKTHRLTQEFKKDLSLNDIMTNGCQETLKNMIESGNSILSETGIYIFIFVYCLFVYYNQERLYFLMTNLKLNLKFFLFSYFFFKSRLILFKKTSKISLNIYKKQLKFVWNQFLLN